LPVAPAVASPPVPTPPRDHVPPATAPGPRSGGSDGGRTLDTAVLDDVARHIGNGLGDVGADLYAPPRTVRRQQVLATDVYDAWVVVWGESAYVEPHDHDGCAGVLRVVAGSLAEAMADLDPGASPRFRQLSPGATSELSPLACHSLLNPTGAPAVTVNVYSPPLGSPV
jgi:hypothetical protein